MYNILISNIIDIDTPTSIKKWNTVLQLRNDFDWKKNCLKPLFSERMKYDFGGSI